MNNKNKGSLPCSFCNRCFLLISECQHQTYILIISVYISEEKRQKRTSRFQGCLYANLTMKQSLVRNSMIFTMTAAWLSSYKDMPLMLRVWKGTVNEGVTALYCIHDTVCISHIESFICVFLYCSLSLNFITCISLFFVL